MEYEFTVVLDLSVEKHVATATKDRTSTMDGQHFVPDVSTGEGLREWLTAGVDPAEASKKALRSMKGQVTRIEAIPHLENWWRKHQADIAALLPDDRETLIAHCANRKDAISAKLAEQAARAETTEAQKPDPEDRDPRDQVANLRQRARVLRAAGADDLTAQARADVIDAQATELERGDAEAA